MAKEIKDWRGSPIKVGSRVVYPSRQRSTMWISEGIVVSVVPRIGVKRVNSQKSTNTYTPTEKISYPSVERLTVIE